MYPWAASLPCSLGSTGHAGSWPGILLDQRSLTSKLASLASLVRHGVYV